MGNKTSIGGGLKRLDLSDSVVGKASTVSKKIQSIFRRKVSKYISE